MKRRMKTRRNTVRRLTVVLLFLVTAAATWQYPLRTRQYRTVPAVTTNHTPDEPQTQKYIVSVVQKNLSVLSHRTPLSADEVAQTMEDRMGLPHTGHPAADQKTAGRTVQGKTPVSSAATKTSRVTSAKTTATSLTTVTTASTVTSATSGKTSASSTTTAKTATTTKANENGNGGNAYIKNPDYRSRYYIVVYTGSQSAVVYGKDNDGQYTRLIKSFTVSTGLKNSSPTRTGVYRIRAKYRWRLLVGNVYGQYSSSISSDYLFHSVPYKRQNASALDNAEYDKLGRSASHGCIRMCVRDCKWIYDNAPIGTQVNVVNASGPAGMGVPARKRDSRYDGWDPSDRWAAGNPYFSDTPTTTTTTKKTTTKTTASTTATVTTASTTTAAPSTTTTTTTATTTTAPTTTTTRAPEVSSEQPDNGEAA